jgi:hypothetical protein
MWGSAGIVSPKFLQQPHIDSGLMKILLKRLENGNPRRFRITKLNLILPTARRNTGAAVPEQLETLKRSEAQPSGVALRNTSS